MPELLEEDIRATAPQPDPDFVARLERRVETGFAKETTPVKPRKQRSWFISSGAFFPAAVCAVFAIVVVGVGLSARGGSDDEGSAGSGSSGALFDASGDRGTAESGAEPAPSPAAPPQDRAVAPGSEPRKREVRTALDLTTPADEFSETTAGVLRVADATGTIVQSSSVSESNGSDVARYDLRVPTSRLDDVMRDLSELGEVERRTEDVQDVTASYVSARDQLEDARDVRRALLKALERADSEGERSAIRARLRDARTQIAAAEAEVRRVRARTDRATVAVTVRSTAESGAWMPADAFDDAVRILEVLAGVALVLLAILAPLGILVVAGIGAARLARRRRRDAVLG